jgi:5'-nucleotidase
VRCGAQGVGDADTVRRVTWLLLTNDDGVDSPALPSFARALSSRADVRIVVPDRERSWVGKAITRFDPVEADLQVRDGLDVWTVSGFPADGVQLAIHALFDDPPDIVVSGINLGYNHGAGFLLSSGTVGAAIEAWLSGVPAIAFSTGVMTGNYREWREHASSPAARDDWSRLAGLCAELLDEVDRTGLLDVADVVSVNLPYEADGDTPRLVTSLARVGYDRLFRHVGDSRYAHDFAGGFVTFDPLDGSDVDAAHQGWVAITPLRMPETVELPDDVRQQIERGRA